MKRRRFLKTGSVAGRGLAFGACTYRGAEVEAAWLAPASLLPVHVS